MNKLKLFGFLITLMSIQTSCITTPTITYFDSADSTKYQILPENIPIITKIRPNDILAITVGSLSEESNDILNFNNINRIVTTNFPGQNMGQGGQPLGFLVDPTGHVELPMVGKINVQGLKLDEAAEKVKAEVEKLLKSPSVTVRFLNHRFTVIGEVNKPAVYNLIDDKTTLPEALALAGDLTAFGNRRNIMIIRDYYGKREMVRLNLLKREIFDSPYYFLKDGDMIYVEPVEGKATYTDKKVQLAPLYLSGVSALVVFVNVLVNIIK
jgi:polysaccharide biosynthesis/export protein